MERKPANSKAPSQGRLLFVLTKACPTVFDFAPPELIFLCARRRRLGYFELAPARAPKQPPERARHGRPSHRIACVISRSSSSPAGRLSPCTGSACRTTTRTRTGRQRPSPRRPPSAATNTARYLYLGCHDSNPLGRTTACVVDDGAPAASEDVQPALQSSSHVWCGTLAGGHLASNPDARSCSQHETWSIADGRRGAQAHKVSSEA